MILDHILQNKNNDKIRSYCMYAITIIVNKWDKSILDQYFAAHHSNLL